MVIETDLEDVLAGLNVDGSGAGGISTWDVGSDEGTLARVGDLRLKVDAGVGRGGILVVGHDAVGDVEGKIALWDCMEAGVERLRES